MNKPVLIRTLASPALFALVVWGHLVLPGLAFAAYLAMVCLIALSVSSLLGTDILPRLPLAAPRRRRDDGHRA